MFRRSYTFLVFDATEFIAGFVHEKEEGSSATDYVTDLTDVRNQEEK